MKTRVCFFKVHHKLSQKFQHKILCGNVKGVLCTNEKAITVQPRYDSKQQALVQQH